MSRREQIKLSPAERRELLGSERVVVISSIGPRGWPHSMPMWFVAREGPPSNGASEGSDAATPEIWVWTYAKSQKVRNLERDPRATLLVEAGEQYGELRGIQVEATAEIIRETDRVLDFAKTLALRYADGLDELGEEMTAALEAQAPKRVAIRFRPVRVASWDHGKLGGGGY